MNSLLLTTGRSEFLRALMFPAIKWEYYHHPYQITVVRIRWEGEKYTVQWIRDLGLNTGSVIPYTQINEKCHN